MAECHGSAVRQNAGEGSHDADWWVCTRGSCVGLQGPVGLREDLLIHISLTLEEMNICLWAVAQALWAEGNLHLCLLSHIYTHKMDAQNSVCFSPIFFSPYGQPSSWHGVSVKCVPPDSPLLFCLSSWAEKSRAAYALNIRPLRMFINPVTWIKA